MEGVSGKRNTTLAKIPHPSTTPTPASGHGTGSRSRTWRRTRFTHDGSLTLEPEGRRLGAYEFPGCWQLAAALQCAEALVGSPMVTRLEAERAEASPLSAYGLRGGSLAPLGPLEPAHFHPSYHLVVDGISVLIAPVLVHGRP